MNVSGVALEQRGFESSFNVPTLCLEIYGLFVMDGVLNLSNTTSSLVQSQNFLIGYLYVCTNLMQEHLITSLQF
jgi:hypothetical protein